MSSEKKLKFCPVCDDEVLLVHEKCIGNLVLLVCLPCNTIYDYYYLRREDDEK